MTHEILPTTSDGVEERFEKHWTKERGLSQTITRSGPANTIESEFDIQVAFGNTNTFLTQLDLSSDRGRATYTQHFMGNNDNSPDVEEFGSQELLAIDIVRPIYAAPYFTTTAPIINAAKIATVRNAVDGCDTEVVAGWDAKQKELFYHLLMGRERYYETAYVFRKTYRVSTGQQVRRAASDINTVVALPDLSASMQNLIDSLPAGEWLKRPIHARDLGPDGWEVFEEYLWALQWSVVYGGTFTGA